MVEILDSIAPRHVVNRALKEAEITRDLLRVGAGFIPYLTEAIILESMARSLGERELGALIGQRFNYDGYQAFAEYVLGAPDLCTALVRSRRAIPLLHTGATFNLRQSGENLVFGYRCGLEHAVGYRHLSDGAIFLITHVFHHFLGADWRPAWIELAGDRRQDVSGLEDLTETRIHTGAEILAIGVATNDLFATNPAPPSVDKVVTLSELPSLMGVRQPKTTADMVKEVLRAHLVLGDVSADGVARRLNLGRRTLQRALIAEGTTFRELRNNVIEARALALLSDSDIKIDHIAESLGYTEPNSFRRAFRTWTGVSPTRFRRQNGQNGF